MAKVPLQNTFNHSMPYINKKGATTSNNNPLQELFIKPPLDVVSQ